MSSNAKTILDAFLKAEQEHTASNLEESSFFELFTAEQILKNYGLSYDEIEYGLVNNRGGDGGIDGFYTFVNGVLATEEASFDQIRQRALIHLFIIQSKISPGFGEDAILKFESTSKDLLDISHDPEDFSSVYNPKVIRATTLFHSTYKALSDKIPDIRVSFYYATKGDEVHPNVTRKADSLGETMKRLFSQCQFNFEFLTASNLITLARKSQVETLSISVSEPLSTQSGTICLVTLREYFKFIYDERTGDIRGWLFEENIRDYEGKNIDVNKGIRKTLADSNHTEDFWWLNNGITIVAREAPLAGKLLTLTDPKIVNGLQTSIEVFNHFRGQLDFHDDRKIMVRVLVTIDDRIRNDIIRATNSQSAIHTASLRAFDEIQYRIEQYFIANGLFYDRRKNFYKNMKKPKEQIISLIFLAQAMAAIVLQRPNDSRGRPATLVKNESTYKLIFSDKYPIAIFLESIRFMKLIDSFLASQEAPTYVIGHEINVRFHSATFAAAMHSHMLRPSHKFIESGGLTSICNITLTRSLDEVWDLLQKRKNELGVDEDRVAKSPDFDLHLTKRIREIHESKSWAQ